MSLAYGTRHPCDSVAPGRVPCTPCARRDRPWVLAVAILGSSLAFIEGSVVNLALPAIQTDLGIGSAALQWVVNAYLLVLGAFLLIGGAAGDRFGLRRMFVAGTALFGLGALAAGLAPSLASLVAFRVVQGLGAAILVPTSLALISRYFDRQERGRAIGTWAGASALTTALGPVLGGWLVDAAGWRAVFLLVAPMALLAILLALWRVPADATRSRQPLDYPGAALLAATLALLTVAVLQPGSRHAPAWLGLALVLGLALFLRERRFHAPMLPLALFRVPAFAGANLMTLLLYAALSGILFFLPFNLIQVQGYSALAAGAAFLPMTLLLGVGSTVAGDLIRRFPPRHVLTVGPAIAGLGFGALALPGTDTRYVTDWLPAIVAIGVGMTVSVAPLTTVVMNSVDDERAGVASGINNTAARLAGVLAIATLTVLAVALFSARLDSRLAAVGVSEALRGQLLAGADRLAELELPAGTAGASALRAIIEASYVDAFRRLALICAAAAGLSALVAWLTLASTRPSRPPG